MQFLTGRKHGQSLEALDTDFTVQLRNEAYKNNAKVIDKFMVRPGGWSHNRPPPEYATAINGGSVVKLS